MSGILGVVAAAKAAIASITSTGNWTGTSTVVTRTISVPSGNFGSVKINSDGASDFGVQYQINGGGFTSVAVGATATFTMTSGQTLGIKIATGSSGGVALGTVKDNTTNATIGTISFTV